MPFITITVPGGSIVTTAPSHIMIGKIHSPPFVLPGRDVSAGRFLWVGSHRLVSSSLSPNIEGTGALYDEIYFDPQDHNRVFVREGFREREGGGRSREV